MLLLLRMLLQEGRQHLRQLCRRRCAICQPPLLRQLQRLRLGVMVCWVSVPPALHHACPAVDLAAAAVVVAAAAACVSRHSNS